MATNNSWNNTINNAKGGITLNAQTNAINIGSDAYNNTIGIGTGAAVKDVSVGSLNTTSTTSISGGSGVNAIAIISNNGTTTLSSSSNGLVNIGSGGGLARVSITSGSGGIDLRGGGIVLNSSGTIDIGKLTVTNETINIGSDTTSARSSFINIGNNIGTSSVAVQCGSGGINIGTNSTNNTINIGTGAGVKTTTLGSTNTTSSTAIKSGSGNIALNSGFTVNSSGINYNTLQPAFLANLASPVNNVTGDGTGYTVLFADVKYNVGSGYNSGTGIFTAPVTGKYQFNLSLTFKSISASYTTVQVFLNASAGQYNLVYASASNFALGNFLQQSGSVLVNMTAGDAISVTASAAGSTKTVGIHGNTLNASNQGFTIFSGCLVC